MNIISNNYNNYINTFKSYRHEVINKNGNIQYRGDTCMFRKDLDLEKIISYFEKKYMNIANVNIIFHACSDGEEVYSFLSKLIDSIGINKAAKYLPITARDIDEEHIKLAKAGKFTIEEFEQTFMNENFASGYKKYFDKLGNNLSKICIVARDSLKNKINFKKSNILNDIKNIQFKNTVLFARNVWPYLSNDDAESLAKSIAEKMDGSSVLIIGDFDKTYNIDMLLAKYGLSESHFVDNVFLKPYEKKISKYLNLLRRIFK